MKMKKTEPMKLKECRRRINCYYYYLLLLLLILITANLSILSSITILYNSSISKISMWGEEW